MYTCSLLKAQEGGKWAGREAEGRRGGGGLQNDELVP